MAIYRLKIVGVHYAVNTDSTLTTSETEAMHLRTAQRLRELDEERPRVVLMPEPSNPVDARAVMARAQFKRIGYVNKEQLDIVHALLQANGGHPLMADIDEVEARKHGWLFVQVKTEKEVPVEPVSSLMDEWKSWTCTFPSIAPDEAQYAREEAEAMLDEVFSKHIISPDGRTEHPVTEADIALIEDCIHQWLASALHDLSNEARLTREHYIRWLEELEARNVTAGQEPSPRIRGLVSALEKQRTALCGNRRMNLRIEGWWKELTESKGMEILWNTWMARTGGDLAQGMNEVETLLRALPFDLYALVGSKGFFFSRLHYNHVPRTQFWQIVSLLLLRERTGMKASGWAPHDGKGYNEPLPPSEEEEEKFVVVIPQELETSEARRILAKLQKKGYLDEDLQPVKLSNTEKAVLAWELTERLRIRKRWAVMATLWKCNPETLRKSRDKGYDKNVASEFTKKMKAIIY